MDLHKIVDKGDRVYIKMLVYNPHVWCQSQWKYLWVTDYYPDDNFENAKNFGLIENAWKWIKENEPN